VPNPEDDGPVRHREDGKGAPKYQTGRRSDGFHGSVRPVKRLWGQVLMAAMAIMEQLMNFVNQTLHGLLGGLWPRPKHIKQACLS
jgi:hypothetical protein